MALTEEEKQAFLQSCRYGDLEAVGAALDANPEYLDITDGPELLIQIALYRHELAKWISNYNLKNLNEKDKKGRTTLIMAAQKGQKEIVEHLLKNGADFNVEDDKEGWTALMWACENEQEEAIKLLLEATLRILNINETIEIAIKKDCKSAVSYLAKHKDTNFNEVLAIAIKKNDDTVISYLSRSCDLFLMPQIDQHSCFSTPPLKEQVYLGVNEFQQLVYIVKNEQGKITTENGIITKEQLALAPFIDSIMTYKSLGMLTKKVTAHPIEAKFF